MSGAEQKLQSCLLQKRNLEAIFNSATDGIVLLGHDLKIQNMNNAAQKMLGILRTDSGSFPQLFPAIKQAFDLADLVADRRTIRGCALSFNNQLGQTTEVSINMATLEDEDGASIGAVLVFENVTEVRRLQEEVGHLGSFHNIVGKSPKMQEVYSLIREFAGSRATVLITGASGTGKELVAAALHYSSGRSGGPLIKVNCSALATAVLESELFGHVRGAYTGAIRDRPGRFELADKGTIFLDEIGELSPEVQVKLLRVLQEKEVERVGESRTRKVDVRIITATNQDLKGLVASGRFREDLYFRLHVIPILLPPLCERKTDIPLLINHFLLRLNQDNSKNIATVSHQLLELLLDYDWPGNIRELQNILEFAHLRCRGPQLEIRDLPAEFRHQQMPAPALVPPALSEPVVTGKLNYQQVAAAVAACQGNKSAAAKMLGVNRSTVWRILAKG